MANYDMGLIILEAKKELARREFFYFCNALAPDFYREEYEYLVDLCNTLQALYEGRIIRFVPTDDWIIVETTDGLENYEVCKKLMLNMPPQHGKSRTLVNFCMWVFGKNPSEKIITASYNDTVASDFSRYTRDGIAEEKQSEDIVYSEIFPKTRIKRGNSSFEKWALEGQHFSYLGAGVGGSVTSKGGTILIVDDPVKGADEAFNENYLEKNWLWYTGTFKSRVSAPGGEPIEIINMTRWADGDLCGRILDSTQARDWYVVRYEAYDEETGKMLCEDRLSYKRYLEQKSTMDLTLFMANYHQVPVNQQGRLYKTFKTYEKIPTDTSGNPLFTGIYSYCDTADSGDDHLCNIIWGAYNKEAYVLDVIYTKEGMEVTEEMVAKALNDFNVNEARIESNHGASAFPRAIGKILDEKYKSNKTYISWFHQSKNKIARIISNASWVMNHIYFPVNWRDKWPEYYKAMTTYQREGKNKHDDAPDATTGVAESMYNLGV